MIIERTNVRSYICDGCDSEQILLEVDVPVGYVGTVMWHHSGGGMAFEWFACKQRCISKAIRTARDREVD